MGADDEDQICEWFLQTTDPHGAKTWLSAAGWIHGNAAGTSFTHGRDGVYVQRGSESSFAAARKVREDAYWIVLKAKIESALIEGRWECENCGRERTSYLVCKRCGGNHVQVGMLP